MQQITLAINNYNL